MTNKESSPEEQERTCTLSDEELWIRCDRWVSKLAESGGRDWVLRVPPDYDNDPDMLFLELLQRFAATFVKAKLTPSEPVEQKPFEDRLKDFINSQQDIPKEISEVVNRRFWDMLEGEQRFTIEDMRAAFQAGKEYERSRWHLHTFDEWIKTH